MSAAKSRSTQPVTVESLPAVFDQGVSWLDNLIDGIVSKTSPGDSKEAVALDPVDDLTAKLGTLGFHHTSERLLFRVVCEASWGSAVLDEDILPEDTATTPFEDPLFDWRAWLTGHGARYGGKSIGTSLTADFLRATTIALQYKVNNKKDIAIIVIQERFLVNGSCHKFDDLISWSDLQYDEFGNLKRNEHIVIGPIPAHAVVSRITFDSLGEWGYMDVFPQLHFDEYRNVKIVRKSIESELSYFDPTSIVTKFFLVGILGFQVGAFPHNSSTWQLLLHFDALANFEVHMQDTQSYESQMDYGAIIHLKKILTRIETTQIRNGATLLCDEERLRGGSVDVEGTVREWARRNPLL